MIDRVERWHQVWALVDAALDLEPRLRSAYLDRACADDPTLRRDVDQVLRGGDEPSFLDSSALGFAREMLDVDDSDKTSIPEQVQTDWGATYAIERELGRGGTATVYLAHDLKHERRIAVKVLHAQLDAFYKTERFIKEIRLTARLQHPHILGLLDSGVFGTDAGPLGGRPFYTMPYVEGESLRERLARGPIPVGEAIAILRDVALALAYAHEHGIIHRDIKPENVLLSSGTAVVSDFGIAKALQLSGTPAVEALSIYSGASSPRVRSTAFGTPAYMAPEQASGDPDMDARADVYSWGVVAYELLAGRHPFAKWSSPGELLAAQMSEIPTPLETIATSLPVGLGALVIRCLARAPGNRPASGGEILAALDMAEVSAGRAKATPSTDPTRRRAITLAAACALLTVATFATLAARTNLRSHATGAERPGSVALHAPLAATVPSKASVVRDTSRIRSGRKSAMAILGDTVLPTKPLDSAVASPAAPNVAYTLWAESFDLGLFADAEHWCADARLRYPNDYRFVRCQLFDILSPSADVTPSMAWALVDTLSGLLSEPENDIELRAARMLVAVALARADLRDSAHAVIEASRTGDGELLGYEALVRVQLGEREEALSLLGDYLQRYPEARLRLARRRTWLWRDLEDDPRFRAMISAK